MVKIIYEVLFYVDKIKRRAGVVPKMILAEDADYICGQLYGVSILLKLSQTQKLCNEKGI